jgi:hypothetical protein
MLYLHSVRLGIINVGFMLDFFLSDYFLLSLAVYIPFFVILFRIKVAWSMKSLRIFQLYIMADVASWIAQLILALNSHHTIIVANIFSVVEFFLISLFFVEIFKLRNKKAYQFVVCLLTLIFSISVFSGNNESYANFSRVIISIIFIISALLFFAKLMREQKVENLFAYPIFWFNTGILVYFSCSIFIMIFSNYFLKMSIEAQKILWLFHSVINLICYVIFATGFYKCKQKTKY